MTLACPECGSPMELRQGKIGNRHYYACMRYPECKGAHGAHRDGTPLGIPADGATKAMRIAAHEVFDALWKDGRMTRSEAYAWMGEVMGLGPDEAHIGRFDKATCTRLIKAVWARS